MAVASLRNVSVVLLLSAAAAGCSGLDTNLDKRPIEYASLPQCDRTMASLDQRVANMENGLKNGRATVELLEEVQGLRQDIPAIETKCSGNDAAVQKLKKLDKDLEALAQRLEIDSHR